MTAEVIRGDRAGITVRQPDPPGPGELTQTPREIEGPYFRLGAPERSILLEPGDKPELVLTGRVLNEKGTPIPNAVVALWSSDAVGNYDMIGCKYHGYRVSKAASEPRSSDSVTRTASRGGGGRRRSRVMEAVRAQAAAKNSGLQQLPMLRLPPVTTALGIEVRTLFVRGEMLEGRIVQLDAEAGAFR